MVAILAAYTMFDHPTVAQVTRGPTAAPTKIDAVANSPTADPTATDFADDDNNPDATNDPGSFDDDGTPECYWQACNTSAHCSVCTPPNVSAYAFCDAATGFCTVCEGCDADTSAVEGWCGLPQLCAVTTTTQPSITTNLGDSNDGKGSKDDAVYAAAIPLLIVVIVASLIGTLYFVRKIRKQNSDGMRQLLDDDNEDVIVTRDTRSAIEMLDICDQRIDPRHADISDEYLMVVPDVQDSQSDKNVSRHRFFSPEPDSTSTPSAVALSGLGYLPPTEAEV